MKKMKKMKNNKNNNALTPKAAKELFFEHWNFITCLARKRFPNDSDLGDQAISYVLDKLEEQEWQRVTRWDGCGSFATFLAVLSTRLMTDFVRMKFGYHRAPAWIKKKKNALWERAFKLCTVDKYERREAIEILRSVTLEMSLVEIEDMVNTVYSKCTKQARFSEGNIDIDQIIEFSSIETHIEKDFNNKKLLEVLLEYIQSEENLVDNVVDDSIKDLLIRLKTNINMSDEDRLLLRLRFCEGLKINEISKMLHLKSNLYKRINGLIDDLRNACQQCEMEFS